MNITTVYYHLVIFQCIHVTIPGQKWVYVALINVLKYIYFNNYYKNGISPRNVAFFHTCFLHAQNKVGFKLICNLSIHNFSACMYLQVCHRRSHRGRLC